MSALDEKSIASAALKVLDARGANGLTMRAVAEVLGVTPMALYHHVADKAALVGLVIDAAIREVPLPPTTGDWRDDLFTMAAWSRRNTRAHPGIVNLRRAYDVWTPTALQMTERSLSLWLESGLDPESAVIAATTSSMAIMGLVSEEQGFRRIKPPAAGLVSTLPNARLLFKSRHNLDDEFELAVRAIIDGLYTRLSTGPKKPSTKGHGRPAASARSATKARLPSQ
ncbi:MAG: TetR/AcrR family transcriptional regulator [Acidimicrobiales bacterium]